MNIHVLPGDSLMAEFAQTGIDGDVIVCRETLIAGDVSEENLDLFWDIRANFIMLDYGGDPIEYRESVAYELEKLIDLYPVTEVNLWFEYELFCQANMWFCLDLLKDHENIYRVAPLNASPDDVWKGFGDHDAAKLNECFQERVKFTEEDLAKGRELWDAFRKRDSARLLDLGNYRSACFPFLKETCTAAAEIETRPTTILKEILATGLSDMETIFPEFQRRAGVYGFGDLQVERLLEKL
jgi:hypothetical protein